ncbi:small multidrug efflux protein [Arthrobacter antioxidans]|uniref:small multidrug efflux protein n=1 Tax=Arthrobacter antioxidans TaxID=2895818 RepID=UPI001FFFEB1E|nr:small multidrug efflux protein [Arthrobacter antioxidans]
MNNPYEGMQEWVQELPEIVQPLGVAVAGMIPYIEGEGAAGIGILLGINPVMAAVAAMIGNFLSVLAVVTISSRVREKVVAGRGGGGESANSAAAAPSARRAKGQRRLQGWLSRFGVPGASLLAPLALPTQLTALFFAASGVRTERVLFWQAIAIVVWTVVISVLATGLVGVLGW